jgi:tetratricopeptide (TPR) repeat protein/tRNA A-37 threonylcarbamoyl transferase component Bud32
MVSRPPPAAKALETAVPSSTAPRTTLGGRYEIIEELGRGGMACVYRALDPRTGREVAIKQLTAATEAKRSNEAALLFEREFYTLAQLSHPRVIRVYDYGVDPAGPYYTMELLDGGDLRERSPVPWREACELIFDVCSSLALLHSRRLVHRDVSPRNVRCTRDGRAKLIDFGAMVSMGSGAALVGTAPFVAPEAVHSAALDARTDLFSLGATLYYALTGRLAFPARDFSQLIDVWTDKPRPPSAYTPEIPEALDQLVLSLISLEPALRPRSASEVMARLATVANIQRPESLDVSKAYLATPVLVGRDEALGMFREHLKRTQHGRGSALLFKASSGLGLTRTLDACALDAKVQGALVARANAAEGGQGLEVVRALAEQVLENAGDAALEAARTAGVFELLFEETPGAPAPANDNQPGSTGDAESAGTVARASVPELRSFGRSPEERAKLQRALQKWLARLARNQPIVLVVDDCDAAGEPSIAFLAALADRASKQAVLLLVGVEERETTDEFSGLPALESRCEKLALRPLTVAETEQLLGSVFGDVPNLALLSARVHEVSRGNPRQAMLLAQYLVDRGTIRYDGGTWSLPAQLTAADLPASGVEAARARVDALPPLARRLLLLQAIAERDLFIREDYHLLAGEEPANAEAALDRLIIDQLVVSGAGSFRLADRTGVDAICAELSEQDRAQAHRELAALYANTERPAFATARHYLLAGDAPHAFEYLLPLLRGSYDRMEFAAATGVPMSEVGRTMIRALRAAVETRVPPLDEHTIRHWMTLVSVVDDDALYWEAAPGWRAQLELDSGLIEYRKRTDIADPNQRLMAALTSAAERHAQLPESERVYAPDVAIRFLVHYVAISIAIGARTIEPKLLLSLPELLEPFAPISPLVAAVWQNSLATVESSVYRQQERSRARWGKVYDDLGQIQGQDPAIVSSIRYAIAFGVGLSEAAAGLESANTWADILDKDPLQQVSAMYLRKVVRLQQGDLEGAERFRKQAELLALQSSSRSMFTNMLSLEIAVHAAAWDLTGVKQIGESIEQLAERHPNWVPFKHLAEGHYQRLRGSLSAALEAYEKCLALCTPDPNQPDRSIMAWPLATPAYVETLIALNRVEEAHAFAKRALAELEARDMGSAGHEVVRTLALAEAKLGDFAGATARLDALIQRERDLGITGLTLGMAYEARTRVAIWAGDKPAVERFAQLTAAQYRHGRGSTLGARYERLMEEARGSGVVVLPPLSVFETTMFGNTEVGARVTAIASIVKTMSGAQDISERAKRALKLMCDARGARGGHLFLGQKSGLQWVASQGAPSIDDVLTNLVEEFWGHQSNDEDDEPDTASLDDEQGSLGYSTQLWTDLHGTPYQPLLLSGKLEGEIVNAGVVLFVPGEVTADPQVSRVLLSELASFLLRTR